MEKLPDNISEEDFVKLAELNKNYEESCEQIRYYKNDTQPWNGGGDGPTMVEGLKPLLEDMKKKLNELNEFCREKGKEKEKEKIIENYIVIDGMVGARAGGRAPSLAFVDRVNAKIKEGYIPQGGIAVGEIYIYQAMVSYKK